jgi:isopentenyl phosphate kinase
MPEIKTNSTFPELQFLKLGGSLITDKARPHTSRPQVLARLAKEIAEVHAQNQSLRLVIGNGAGSFAHVPAKKYGTRQGVRTPEEWRGFAEVWREAAALNSLVTDALQDAGLPAIAIHPSSVLVSRNRQVVAWDLASLRAALHAGLVPVVHGDVVFDTTLGGTIFSTEDLFEYLARQLSPRRILLAGLEQGVWADYPTCTRLIPEITPGSLEAVAPALGGSNATDVTGGMASKVRQSLALAQEITGLEILIFSGEHPGTLKKTLLGGRVGTAIYAAKEQSSSTI